ncbi:MAG: helix-turn-helix transcriptional regulator [Dehalococcoidia bacterium]
MLSTSLSPALTLVEGDGDTVVGCRCDGRQPKNFARPCLLLLLAEGSAHGYELMEWLRPFGFLTNDPATVYRGLRQMESERLVDSRWDTASKGAARRIYSLTADGSDLLAAWARTLEQNRRILEYFQERFELAVGQGTRESGS